MGKRDVGVKATVPPVFWAFFPLFFVAMWLLVCLLISLMGWRTLANHFRAQSKPQGRSFPMQGAKIGGGQYSGCLSMIVAETGLWLRLWIPFRTFHPPIFLPWNVFEAPKLEKRFWVKQWTTQVITPDKNRVKIIFSPAIGELLAARIEAERLAPDASAWS